jgi:hypothetical protein
VAPEGAFIPGFAVDAGTSCGVAVPCVSARPPFGIHKAIPSAMQETATVKTTLVRNKFPLRSSKTSERHASFERRVVKALPHTKIQELCLPVTSDQSQ